MTLFLWFLTAVALVIVIKVLPDLKPTYRLWSRCRGRREALPGAKHRS